MKRVLITGHSGGLGQALVNAFRFDGYHTIGIDIKKSKTDVDEEHIIDMNTLIMPNINNIDVIINNAAIQIKKNFNEIDVFDWTQTININVIYPSLLAQYFKKSLIRNKGHIINIGSIHSQQTKKDFHLYATSKGALETLTKSLSLELAPNVKVNMISPAAIDTEMLRAGLSDDSYKELEKYHPCESIGEPRRIAKFILNLVNNDDTFLTGSIINYNGGISIRLSDPES